MDRLCEHLLARAGLTREQHRSGRTTGPFNQRKDLEHGGAFADDAGRRGGCYERQLSQALISRREVLQCVETLDEVSAADRLFAGEPYVGGTGFLSPGHELAVFD